LRDDMRPETFRLEYFLFDGARIDTMISSIFDIYFALLRYIIYVNQLAERTSRIAMVRQPEPDLDEVIKALAHPVRRQMLEWLKDPQKSFPSQVHSFELGVCAGKINEKAKLSQSTISAHLATLQRAGLITPRKVGQWIFYSRNEALIGKFLSRINSEL
jgi:DNA-binding transcriptional ArsR family regulator